MFKPTAPQVVASACVDNVMKSLPRVLAKYVITRYADENTNGPIVTEQDLYEALVDVTIGSVIELYGKYKPYLTEKQKEVFHNILTKSLIYADNRQDHLLAYIILAVIDGGSRWIKDLYDEKRYSACLVYFAVANDYDEIAKDVKERLDAQPIKNLNPQLIDTLLSKYHMYTEGHVALGDILTERVCDLIRQSN